MPTSQPNQGPTDQHDYPHCPYLGAYQEPESYYSYPTPANFCQRLTPARPIARAYQGETCLSKGYRSCEFYTQNWSGELPWKVGAPETSAPARTKRSAISRRLAWTLIVLAVAVTALLTWIQPW